MRLPPIAILAVLLSSSTYAAEKEPVEPAVVATHYFYWYRWPDQHFNQPGALVKQGHFHTLPKRESVSYLNEHWHAENLRSMSASGIDIALPVYWGAPGAYEHPNCRFSVAGLGPMVAAAKKLGEHSPKLGLFYDTSSLLNEFRGVEPSSGRPDLTSDAGRNLFCQTVIEYYERIPQELWGRIDGRALVVTYSSGFATKWDEFLGRDLRAAFAKRFPGESVYLVADASWGKIGQDRTTGWGAALNGPVLNPGVAQIGAGYDDTPARGAKVPTREREDGNFYRYSWRTALAHKPKLVLIETWNEMHEGTEICETLETGKKYLDLTSEWIKRLKQNQDPGPEIKLRYPHPRARPDLSWGKSAVGKKQLKADFTTENPHEGGIRERAWEDGPLERIDGALRSPANGSDKARYLYFQVSDRWGLEVPSSPQRNFYLEVVTAAKTSIDVEFDSHKRSAKLAGTYTPSLSRQRKGTSHRHFFYLPAVYFANRQNGGSDFRLILRGQAPVDVISVTIRPPQPKQE